MEVDLCDVYIYPVAVREAHIFTRVRRGGDRMLFGFRRGRRSSRSMERGTTRGDKETPEKLLLVKVFTWLTTQMITGG